MAMQRFIGFSGRDEDDIVVSCLVMVPYVICSIILCCWCVVSLG